MKNIEQVKLFKLRIKGRFTPIPRYILDRWIDLKSTYYTYLKLTNIKLQE